MFTLLNPVLLFVVFPADCCPLLKLEVALKKGFRHHSTDLWLCICCFLAVWCSESGLSSHTLRLMNLKRHSGNSGWIFLQTWQHYYSSSVLLVIFKAWTDQWRSVATVKGSNNESNEWLNERLLFLMSLYPTSSCGAVINSVELVGCHFAHVKIQIPHRTALSGDWLKTSCRMVVPGGAVAAAVAWRQGWAMFLLHSRLHPVLL